MRKAMHQQLSPGSKPVKAGERVASPSRPEGGGSPPRLKKGVPDDKSRVSDFAKSFGRTFVLSAEPEAAPPAATPPPPAPPPPPDYPAPPPPPTPQPKSPQKKLKKKKAQVKEVPKDVGSRWWQPAHAEDNSSARNALIDPTSARSARASARGNDVYKEFDWLNQPEKVDDLLKVPPPSARPICFRSDMPEHREQTLLDLPPSLSSRHNPRSPYFSPNGSPLTSPKRSRDASPNTFNHPWPPVLKPSPPKKPETQRPKEVPKLSVLPWKMKMRDAPLDPLEKERLKPRQAPVKDFNYDYSWLQEVSTLKKMGVEERALAEKAKAQEKAKAKQAARRGAGKTKSPPSAKSSARSITAKSPLSVATPSAKSPPSVATPSAKSPPSTATPSA
uniref:Uncharacterized protein n=1 Tax=Haptolina brevifila TaxID=156173 RepID=A0A7S2HHH7_9EUKA